MGNICEIPALATTSDEIKEILASAKTIAVVGLSPKEDRDSNKVARYLRDMDYRIIPVNPNHNEIIGLKSYPDLAEINEDIDVVDIFRKPDAIPEIMESAIKKNVKVIWMQEGIVHNEAAEIAKGAGLNVVMNKCMMKEHQKMVRDDGTFNSKEKEAEN